MNDPQMEHRFALHHREAALEADLRALDDDIEHARPEETGYRRLLRERRVAAKLLSTVRVTLQLSGGRDYHRGA